MPKVTQRLDYTVNMGNFENVKVGVEIGEIDTEQDIEQQVEDARAALNKMYPLLLKAVTVEAAKAKEAHGSI